MTHRLSLARQRLVSDMKWPAVIVDQTRFEEPLRSLYVILRICA